MNRGMVAYWIKRVRVIGFFIAVLLPCSGLSAIDAYDFNSEDERSRYQVLAQELRCPKCQNQNLTDSNSAIAVDLRNEVARMIREGRSDSEIKTYMVNRYGDFVLYNPPVQSNTLVLWWAPLGMLLVGISIFGVILVRRRKLVSSHEIGHSEPSNQAE